MRRTSFYRFSNCKEMYKSVTSINTFPISYQKHKNQLQNLNMIWDIILLNSRKFIKSRITPFRHPQIDYISPKVKSNLPISKYVSFIGIWLFSQLTPKTWRKHFIYIRYLTQFLEHDANCILNIICHRLLTFCSTKTQPKSTICR